MIAIRSLKNRSVEIVGSFRDLYDGITYLESSVDCKKEISNYALWAYAKKHPEVSACFYNVETLELPCGHCIGCRLEYSRQWANRCVLESLMRPMSLNWFLTLTIDDDCIGEYVTKNGFATVRNNDISKFMKALRQHWAKVHGVESKIRFFAASEYGDESMRPHYHILVFGLPLYDLEFYKNNEQGDVLFKSAELYSIWKKGFVTVGEFNWNTAAYTARYVMKKAQGKMGAYYDALDIEPEKTRMSRRPGIAVEFLEANIDNIYDLDEIVLPASKGKLHAISPPKYFDKKLEIVNPLLYEHVKSQRDRIAKLRELSESQAHGYDPLEYLEVKESHKEKSLKIFRRGLDK